MKLIALMVLFVLLAVVPSPIKKVPPKVKAQTTHSIQTHTEASQAVQEKKAVISQPEPEKPSAAPDVQPQQTPEPAPIPKAEPQLTITGSCDLASKYDWPVAVAKAICMAESSGIPSKSNYDDIHKNADGSVRCVGSFGLMQNACFWFPYFGYSSADYWNGDVAMDIAYKIYSRQGGFGAWTTYTSGAYLKYLK